jgi:hypothetical protein
VSEWGVLSGGGVYNYGDNPAFNRQHNIQAWLITSATMAAPEFHSPEELFTATGFTVSSNLARLWRDGDDYVYASFPAADDGQSYQVPIICYWGGFPNTYLEAMPGNLCRTARQVSR